jgi:hypothetical protein
MSVAERLEALELVLPGENENLDAQIAFMVLTLGRRGWCPRSGRSTGQGAARGSWGD